MDTGHWIDKACTAASGCDALFRVDLTAGTGIQSVSGAGNYTAGAAVTVNAVVKMAIIGQAGVDHIRRIQSSIILLCLHKM